MSRSINHDQARGLAARRLDEPITSVDQAALEAHLEGCSACSAIAAGYEADRLALRAMSPIEPPRDLWARTRVALEREHAQRPRIARRSPRRWGPVAELVSGVALVLVIVIVGPTLIGQNGGLGTIGLAASGLNGTPAAQPVVTPITVNAQVTWAVTQGSDGTSLVTANLSSVCPTGDETDCPPVAGVSRSLQGLPTVPTSVVLSPTNDTQGFAVGPSTSQAGTSLYLLSVPPEPTPGPAASTAPASTGPTSSQAPVPSPTRTPVPSQSQAPASPSVTPSPSPVRTSPTPLPMAVPTPSPTARSGSTALPASPPPSSGASPTPPASAAISPPPSDAVSPSAAAALAIVSNVVLVGDGAAYSQDGQWFAFSARPAGTSVGPDIYVWQASWPAAKPITSNHDSVFSGWVDGKILASQAIPAAAAGPSGAGSSAQTGPQLATPAAFEIDPGTGQSSRIVGLDGWRPVVDPSGRWVSYWSGSLVFDPASGAWQPQQGQLEVASWAAVSSAPDGKTGAAAAHPLAFSNVGDWEVRWDQAGQHLGVWIADADNPGLGSLSLLTIDPASGVASSAAPSLLSATPAERGFTLQDGQLVWASPPGQDGLGSHLSILAWTGPNAGKKTVEPIPDGALLVVH